jgi:hypothetical protein
MKKRTKISLGTKIYLTIGALLVALGGMLKVYAAPVAFSSGAPIYSPGTMFPTGVAASPDLLLVTPYCGENILSLDCAGQATVYATFPGFGSCREKYVSMAPAQSAAAGFTPRDVFGTEGALIFKITNGNVSLFAALPGCVASDHNGITFDHIGTYGFDMIVTCNEGNVFRVHGDGTVTHIATLFPPDPTQHAIEGPAVVPLNFGATYGGRIWLADETGNAIHMVGLPGDGYPVTLNIGPHVNPEGIYVIPNPPCSYCTGNGNWGFFTAEQQQLGLIWAYPVSDFTGLNNDLLILSEAGGLGANTDLVTTNGIVFQQNQFGNGRIPGVNEGSSFVDCDVPTPTPTPSPTATFTPTATSTPTATFTPTATATATSTPTPTATPTATQTPTTCGTAFVIGDLDAVVGNHVTFWGAQWWKKNHLSGGTAPASFKGFANCTNPNPPTCGGTWQSDPGNSSHPPDTVPADITVIVSSLITKSGPIESGDIPMMVTIHTDPGYGPNPGHEGTGTVTAVVCQPARPHNPGRAPRPLRPAR